MPAVEFTLDPLPTAVEKSVPDGSGIVRTAFGKRNRILVAPPEAFPFEVSKFDISKKELARLRDLGSELVGVRTTISFVPDHGCGFVAADLTLAFAALGHQSRPIVIDIRPRETTRKEAYSSQNTKASKVSASANPGFAKLIGELSEKKLTKSGGKRIMRDLYAFGLNGSEAGWHFQSNPGNEISGVYDNLIFALRVPPMSKIRAEVRFGAEIAIQDAVDRWATLAFGISKRLPESQAVFDLNWS
jgi:hypothetical protein